MKSSFSIAHEDCCVDFFLKYNKKGVFFEIGLDFCLISGFSSRGKTKMIKQIEQIGDFQLLRDRIRDRFYQRHEQFLLH